MTSHNSPSLLSQGIGQANNGNVSAVNYANATKRNLRANEEIKFTKEQGIIMHAVDGIDAEEYVYALGEITNPTNIINFSKISNQRIRIYLKDKDIAQTITNTYKTIKVLNQDIHIRPLSIQSKRLVISGATPEMPNQLIINELKRLGMNPTSSMNFLRAGLKKPNFEHILSAKRCIYISKDSEQNTIPETTMIEFEGSYFRLFLSDDSLFCLLCKKHGHDTSTCRNKSQQNQPNDQTNQNEPNLLQETPSEKESQSKSIENFPQNKNLLSQPVNHGLEPTYLKPGNSQKHITKRPLTTNLNSTDASETEEESKDSNKHKEATTTDHDLTDHFETVNLKKKKKRTKKTSSTSSNWNSKDTTVDEILFGEINIKHEMEKHPEKYCLNWEKLQDLLENTQGSNNSLEISQEYETNTENLIETLDALYPLIVIRSNKHKFTLLKNKLIHEKSELQTEHLKLNMTESPTTPNNTNQNSQ